MLPRPRERQSPNFGALVDEIYGIMTDRPTAAAIALAGHDAVEKVAMLPHASVDGIAGLVELVLAAGDRIDLGALANMVGFEIDDLFPIVDALVMLGLARVDGGKVDLTPEGERFGAADIQQSKEIFRALTLERVPIVARIHRALQHSSDGTLREGFFLDLLHRQFSNDEAHAQLETAIDWARYAELFEYDAARGEIKLGAPHQAAT
jgi:NitT/TauT family transport system ATP-binding protein